ncbi:MAG: AAA family ATPase, partial [Candidatus Tectomicrobia bacterium]|nr:AAA family ATPase [Candidatus Tectomicrobia bacterium]
MDTKGGMMPDACIFRFGPFHLDIGDERLWREAESLRLTAKAFAVLRYLVEHADQLVTKDDLFDAVWMTPSGSEASLASCIRDIRRVLGDEVQAPQFVETVRGRGYRFVAPVQVETPKSLSISVDRHAAPLLIGREDELAQLHHCLTRVQQGERRIVFITGEAGIGKTTLVDAFVSQIATEEKVWIGRGQCIEQYGSGEAYLPLLEVLGELGRGPGGAELVGLLGQQAPNWLLQLPALATAAELEALQRQVGGITRERMLRELTEAVEAVTVERSLVLVLEDLHWSDVSTLEWLAYVARRRQRAGLLVLGTYRLVEATVHAHPVRTMAQDLWLHGQCVDLVLEYLSEAEIGAYLRQRFAGATEPDGLARTLRQRTNGNPLFLVNVVDDLIRQGTLWDGAAGWYWREGVDLVAMGVPMSLRQLIEYQFELLPPEEQIILEAASVVGMEFSAAAVAAAVGQLVEEVESGCNGLARRSQFVQVRGTETWPDGTMVETYGFIHALYQESLYDRVPASRRVRWHREIGLRQEVGYGAQAQAVAAELAVHFVRGREPQRAVQYLRQAADNATRRHAPQEAIDHLTIGLDMLNLLPDTPDCLQQELAMQTSIGTALVATTGPASSEVQHAYTQARALGQRAGDVPQLFPALVGLWDCYLVRAEHHRARELGEQLETLAQREPDPSLLLEAHRTLGTSLLFCGELTSAHFHLGESLAHYQPQQHRSLAFLYGQDPGVICRLHTAMTLWLLGYADQALQQIDTALDLAYAQAHPFSLVFA